MDVATGEVERRTAYKRQGGQKHGQQITTSSGTDASLPLTTYDENDYRLRGAMERLTSVTIFTFASSS